MKLKRLLSGVLAAAVALTTMALAPFATAGAADVVASGVAGYGSDVTWTLDSDGVCTLSGSGTAENLSELVSNYGTDIKEIIFEDGFTIIGGYIFRNLTELRKVTIKGDTLTAIYSDVFSGCTSLEEIYIYPKYINYIDISSFDTSNNPVFYAYLGSKTENYLLQKGFTNIGNIEDPSQVTGDAADLTKLFAAIVSANNYYFGMYTEESYQPLADALATGNELRFNESATQDEVDAAAAAIRNAISNLVEADVITNVCGNDVTWTLDKTTGLMTISGTGAMYNSTPNAVYTGCTSWGYYKYANKIKEVVIEEGVTSIGGYAFGTTSHTTQVNAFPNLTKITLPSTIELIAEGAFLGSHVTNLVVPENVTEIDAHAYSHSQIENVELKEGMTIGGMAFAYCDSLKEVTVSGNITWIQSGGHTDNSPASQFCDSGVEKVTVLGGGTVVQRFGTYENYVPDQMFEGC